MNPIEPGHAPPKSEHRDAAARAQFKSDILAGLMASPKTLPCKYFYDTRGSALFEQICETPEYYVTRTELALLRDACPQIAQKVGPGADILEPGSGAGQKIRVLLNALDSPRSFTPIDISQSALETSAKALRAAYPGLDVRPLVADFSQRFQLPPDFSETASHRKLIFFPGSTISNFAPPEATSFLARLRTLLSAGDFLFIGVDRVKSVEILERAYNDAQGITAKFNLNLIERIARELPTTISAKNFTHRARYHVEKNRIEMHLVSRSDQTVQIAGVDITFRAGETIHTENSYKYTPEAFTALAERAGYRVENHFTDPQSLFSLYLCGIS